MFLVKKSLEDFIGSLPYRTRGETVVSMDFFVIGEDHIEGLFSGAYTSKNRFGITTVYKRDIGRFNNYEETHGHATEFLDVISYDIKQILDASGNLVLMSSAPFMFGCDKNELAGKLNDYLKTAGAEMYKRRISSSGSSKKLVVSTSVLL